MKLDDKKYPRLAKILAGDVGDLSDTAPVGAEDCVICGRKTNDELEDAQGNKVPVCNDLMCEKQFNQETNSGPKPGDEMDPEALGAAEPAFLKFVADPAKLKEKGYSDLKIPADYVSKKYPPEIWAKAGQEPEVIINYDAKKIIEGQMNLDAALTEKCAADFENYDTHGWAEWRESWVKKQSWQVGRLGSGNTYNEDSSYFWGTPTFEWTAFETQEGKDGVILMWHQGGDVRANYSYPEVWFGAFEDAFSEMSPSDPGETAAQLLGYETWDALIADIKQYVGSGSKQ